MFRLAPLLLITACAAPLADPVPDKPAPPLTCAATETVPKPMRDAIRRCSSDYLDGVRAGMEWAAMICRHTNGPECTAALLHAINDSSLPVNLHADQK